MNREALARLFRALFPKAPSGFVAEIRVKNPSPDNIVRASNAGMAFIRHNWFRLITGPVTRFKMREFKITLMPCRGILAPFHILTIPQMLSHEYMHFLTWRLSKNQVLMILTPAIMDAVLGSIGIIMILRLRGIVELVIGGYLAGHAMLLESSLEGGDFVSGIRLWHHNSLHKA